MPAPTVPPEPEGLTQLRPSVSEPATIFRPPNPPGEAATVFRAPTAPDNRTILRPSEAAPPGEPVSFPIDRTVLPTAHAAPPQATPANDTGMDIAKFLIQDGAITEKQLQYALRIWSKLSVEKPLLTVLNELGYVTLEQQRVVLRNHRNAVRIGALLVQLGHLREQDLRAALALQKESKGGKKLGEILLENHFIEENRLVQVLADQLGFEQVSLDLSRVHKKMLEKANPDWCLQRFFVPITGDDGQLCVAFSDPLDPRVKQDAVTLFGDNFTTLIASKSAIRETIDAFKRHSQNASGNISAGEDTSQVIALVDQMLLDSVNVRASDVHVEPMKDQLRVRFRCDGVLGVYKKFDKRIAPAFVNRIKILGKADIAERRRHQDGHISFEDVATGKVIDIRVSIYVTIYGEKVVLRLLRKAQLVPVNQIGMFPRVLNRFCEDALELPSGIIFVAGPTGTGKTTTLYSCVSHLNSIECCIITAEDPVEYVIEGVAQCLLKPKIDLTFETTLPHMMRQDPDVIVMGEVRDHFSAEAAIEAALTGHKVLTTFHTEDSIGAIVRLINMGIESFMIASTVTAVLAQRLLRRVCPACAKPYQPNSNELQRLGYSRQDVENCNFRQGYGCPECNHSGYKGRVGVFELLILNTKVREAILKKCTGHEIRQIALDTGGLVMLLEDGLLRATMGETTLTEMFRYLPRIEKPRPLPEIKRRVGLT